MILLDIEGTTTPIAFVTATLVPYARAHIRAYLERHGDSPQYVSMLESFRREHAADAQARRPVPRWSGSGRNARASVEAYAAWLIEHDRKSTPLKELQGYIWEEGYRSGELVAPVYPDVPLALNRWRTAGREIGIFSSGSVLAQRWLFRCSTAGDLTPYLRWYFDTHIGPKQDANSYERIARETGHAPAKILFISDVLAELDAARAAGMQTTMSVRPGNAPQPDHDHRVVTSLDEIPSA
ncbi:MAG TPA: acireductone synthase [Vicinamibacterales bacterium]|nr:acireductone synthase [Vicinamibacterales bacterium]